MLQRKELSSANGVADGINDGRCTLTKEPASAPACGSVAARGVHLEQVRIAAAPRAPEAETVGSGGLAPSFRKFRRPSSRYTRDCKFFSGVAGSQQHGSMSIATFSVLRLSVMILIIPSICIALVKHRICSSFES
ncbi:hypothetical protein mRhiFer1_010271 [Rhinolophus ferrumequinum]|uniref:Uncharacterized protein n=1 Tax=Rhinolophus ferrumequinum TaxID=59479 RepID=A0A7J7X6G5_RHIFE|nr:hypothetical protein mRhiFer1_010271 [Rhinolophus ferrumequinum]